MVDPQTFKYNVNALSDKQLHETWNLMTWNGLFNQPENTVSFIAWNAWNFCWEYLIKWKALQKF